MTPSGAYRNAHVAQGPFFHPQDAMRHNRNISGAWMTFVLDKSEGFTQAGVEHLNDSIRTYVWAILGVQAQTRSNILKTGTGFGAKKQFLADIEDAMANAHKFSASQVAVFHNVPRSQETIEPMIPGRAAAALPSLSLSDYLSISLVGCHSVSLSLYTPGS